MKVKISDICSRFSSGSFIKARDVHSYGKYPVYGGNGVRGYTDTYNFSGKCVIIGRVGAYCGNVHYFEGKAFITDNAIIVQADKKNSTGWLGYKLKTMNLKQFQGQSAQPVLSTKTLLDLEISVPPLKEQVKIFNHLNNIDTKIANNNAISKELESMAKTIYDYWFLQFEFPDKDGKPYKSNGGKMVWNDQLKQEIPEGWEVGTLDQLFQITMGTSPKGDTLNQDSNGVEFYQGSTDFGDLYPQLRVFTTNPLKKVMAQDILLSVRAPVGALNLAKNDCSIGRGLAGIHYDLSSTYAWNKLKSFQKYFDIFNSTGTTFGSLTGEMLNKLIVIIPDTKIIKLYANETNFIEKAMKMYNIENQQLKSLRDFLLPLLMNGQVSITD